ncbi:MAG TPA: hypothetical protein VKA15_11390 [Isosphaeraceae bacterium]|nr:hypothetical protein [Isosphaeraceae bacterium]
MGYATLVEQEINDVPKLIDQLKRDNFDVKAAFWYYRSEADQWYLYLVSDAVHQNGIFESYMAVNKAIRQMTDLEIDPFHVKLVAPDDSIAKAIMDFLPERHERRPKRIWGMNLGGVHIESAYLYYL